MNMLDWLHAIRTHLDSADPGRLLHRATTPSNVSSALAPFIGGPLGMAAAHGNQPSDILPPRAPVAPPSTTPVNMPPLASPPISSNNTPPPYPLGSDPMTAGGPLTPPPAPSAPSYPMGSDPMTAGGIGPSVPLPAPRPAQTPPQAVPLPMARPDAAPSPMGFFARNTAMMRDPISGDYLDPAAAQKADATGPEVIQKFMNYFHNKDTA